MPSTKHDIAPLPQPDMPTYLETDKTLLKQKQLDLATDLGGIEINTYDKILEKKFADAHDVSEDPNNLTKILNKKITKDYNNLIKILHKKITKDYGNFAPHVNGYYYIQMIHGTWVDTVQTLGPIGITSAQEESTVDQYESDYKKSNDTSKFTLTNFNKVSKEFGQLASDIDIPQLNIEYESISGKARNLNYASRLHYAGDFSINYIEEYNNHVFRYHEAWFKYIDALKKGYIVPNLNDNNQKEFIDVPYFNAVWVILFAPFTTNIRGLIKILGVAPINLPFKQIIGDRGKNTLSTINQNYKSNDMVYKFFENDADRIKSELFTEFMIDMSTIHELK